MIKELITIANELDKRGLVSEASILDKIAGDILQFDLSKRKKYFDNPILHPNGADILSIKKDPPKTYENWDSSDSAAPDSELESQMPQGVSSEDDPAPLGWTEIVDNDYFDNPILHPNGAEQTLESDEIIKAFIKEFLSPKSRIQDDEVLGDILYSDSEDLAVYMTEVMPNLIYTLTESINDGDDSDSHKDRILDLGKEMKEYSSDDDFKYIINAMNHYFNVLGYDF